MINKSAGALIIFVLLFIAGCKQDMDNTKLAPYLYDYVPTDVSHSVLYDVDSISYSYTQGGSQVIDTIHYQLKEVILDTFIGLTGNVCYGMAEYKRYDTTQSFLSAYQAWYFYVNRTTLVTDYQDLSFENFTFPPITGNTWQGNSLLPANDTIADTYQVYANWTYTFTSVNVPNTINSHHFDSTAVVTQVNSQNLINDVYCAETYARHVGLVYRQWEVIGKQDVTSTWAAPNQANGFRVQQYFHSYTP